MTVIFPFSVTLHVMELADVQPVHDEKLFPPDVEGAKRMICVPEPAITEKLVVPVTAALLPFSV